MILLLLGAALAGDLPLDTSLSLTPDGAFVLRFVPSEAWRSVEVRVGAEEVQELGPLAAGVAVELKGRTTWSWPTVVSFSGQIDDRRGFLAPAAFPDLGLDPTLRLAIGRALERVSAAPAPAAVPPLIDYIRILQAWHQPVEAPTP